MTSPTLIHNNFGKASNKNKRITLAWKLDHSSLKGDEMADKHVKIVTSHRNVPLLEEILKSGIKANSIRKWKKQSIPIQNAFIVWENLEKKEITYYKTSIPS